MTNCADSAALRTHLDHPSAALDAHLDSCHTCSGLLRSVAADAGFTKRSLVLLDPAETFATRLDVDAALAVALTKVGSAPVVAGPTDRRRGVVGRRIVFAGVAALMMLIVGLTPAGRDTVADALDAFRGERLQVVVVDTEAWAASLDPEGVQALATIGEIDMSGMAEPHEVSSAAEAEAVSGIAAPTLTAAPDRFVAMAPGTARLELLVREGNGVPAELDGAALILEVPGAVGAIYGPPDRPPELVIGRSGALVIRAEGAPLEAIRSFVLSRPELPADLRSQLAAMGDWRSTIPVPVPVDGPSWKEVEVDGRPAIALGDDSGVGALVIRQDPDGVTVVVGRVGVRQALELAAGA
ncbi:MAG TPA: hypothetical protein VJ796_04425 [Acidimicrobiia bacterium]|nr:hypothetical protein [Acidimicrobiia bacterium]